MPHFARPGFVVALGLGLLIAVPEHAVSIMMPRSDVPTPRLVQAGNRSVPRVPMEAGPWVFEDLPVPGERVVPTGINDHGDIAGYYVPPGASQQLGFLILDGEFMSFKIEVPDALDTLIWGINNDGTIVGSYEDGGGVHGWVMSGDTLELVDFPGAEGGSWVRTINNNGDIGGWHCKQALCSFLDGWVRDASGNFSAVPVPPGGYGSTIEGVNDRRDFVGNYSFQLGGPVHGYGRIDGRFFVFDVPGAQATYLLGLRNDGVAVGSFNLAFETLGLVRLPHGDFLEVDPPNSLFTIVYDINAAGDLVGEYTRLDKPVGSVGFIARRVAQD